MYTPFLIVIILLLLFPSSSHRSLNHNLAEKRYPRCTTGSFPSLLSSHLLTEFNGRRLEAIEEPTRSRTFSSFLTQFGWHESIQVKPSDCALCCIALRCVACVGLCSQPYDATLCIMYNTNSTGSHFFFFFFFLPQKVAVYFLFEVLTFGDPNCIYSVTADVDALVSNRWLGPVLLFQSLRRFLARSLFGAWWEEFNNWRTRASRTPKVVDRLPCICSTRKIGVCVCVYWDKSKDRNRTEGAKWCSSFSSCSAVVTRLNAVFSSCAALVSKLVSYSLPAVMAPTMSITPF